MTINLSLLGSALLLIISLLSALSSFRNGNKDAAFGWGTAGMLCLGELLHKI